MPFQTTLFIGLGGTGKEILLRLRRRIMQHEWPGGRLNRIDDFPAASFIYFDLETVAAVIKAQLKDLFTEAIAFKEHETLQGCIDFKKYAYEIDKYPHVREWLPYEEMKSLLEWYEPNMVRAMARLCFFERFDALHDKVKRKSQELLANASDLEISKQLGNELRPELRIVVVCSCAGGTGSGSFIDTGYMLRSIEFPKPEKVDLFMLLPGGFSVAGQPHFEANSFAALMELEYCMRPNPRPPYVSRWTEAGEGPKPGIVPYSDVFLVDTTNVMSIHTRQVSDVYDMVADSLFEDFGSSDFSTRKRSIAVNQTRLKLAPYMPRVGTQQFIRQMAYSSFGLSTIYTKGQELFDTAVLESCKTMLKIFFNVAMGDKSRLPTTAERDDFLEEFFHLRRTAFAEPLEGIDNSTINEFELVDELLKLPHGGGTVVSSIHRDIDYDFSNIESTDDVANWPALVRDSIAQRIEDVDGSINSEGGAGVQGKHILRAMEVFLEKLAGVNGAESEVKTALFRYLDNRERGGLDFTIALIEKAKLRMANDLLSLKDAENDYRARSEMVEAFIDKVSLANLSEAEKKHFMGPDRKAAHMYMGHLKAETKYFIMLLLRRKACEVAVELLEKSSKILGSRVGVDEDGETTLWDGLAGTLVDGRLAVKATLKSLDKELQLVRPATEENSHGMYILLPSADDATDEAMEEMMPDLETAQQWAIDVFRDIGGSEVLFPRLRDSEKRVTLLNMLRSYVKTQLQPKRTHYLKSALELLSKRSDRRKILEQAVMRAMPWIDADFGIARSNGVVMDERFQVIVAVDSLKSFEQSGLQSEIESLLPRRLGVRQIEYRPTGERDRIVIYCELSGIPLDSITHMHGSWHKNYDKVRSDFHSPLHNCIFKHIFDQPTVPTSGELSKMHDRMAIFLRGVALGVIFRVDASAGAPYQVKRGGYQLRIGTEHMIKVDGLKQYHEEIISDQIKKSEQKLASLQLLALAILMEWNARYAYTPQLTSKDNGWFDEEIRGIEFTVAQKQAAEYERRAKNITGAIAEDDIESTKEVLDETIKEWTEEIPGSIHDTDDQYVRQGSDGGATNLRRIHPEKFELSELEQLIGYHRA